MSNLSFRRIGIADIPIIRRMAEVTFPATYAEILSPEQLDYMMQMMYSPESLQQQMEHGHTFFVASDESRTDVGYVSVERQEPRLFHLQKLYVLPEFQGLGYGRELITYAFRYASSQTGGQCRVQLNVNRYNKALDFYRKIGMKQVAKGDFPIGNGYFMNDYIMEITMD